MSLAHRAATISSEPGGGGFRSTTPLHPRAAVGTEMAPGDAGLMAKIPGDGGGQLTGSGMLFPAADSNDIWQT